MGQSITNVSLLWTDAKPENDQILQNDILCNFTFPTQFNTGNNSSEHIPVLLNSQLVVLYALSI